MLPIRELGSDISSVSASQIRPIRPADFHAALRSVRPSTNTEVAGGDGALSREHSPQTN